MTPLTPDPADMPRHMPDEPCCFCGKGARTWYAPKDVAVCEACADARDPDEVPTKAAWCHAVDLAMERKGTVARRPQLSDDRVQEHMLAMAAPAYRFDPVELFSELMALLGPDRSAVSLSAFAAKCDTNADAQGSWILRHYHLDAAGLATRRRQILAEEGAAEVPDQGKGLTGPMEGPIGGADMKGTTMTTELETPVRTVGLTINAPAVFARPDFMAWLNDAGNKTFTWHDVGTPLAHEYSDVVVLVDSGYEGDSSNMPNDVWRAICDAAYAAYGGEGIPLAGGSHVAVRLTNLS